MAKSVGLKFDELELLRSVEIKNIIRGDGLLKYKKIIDGRNICVFGLINGRDFLITQRDAVKDITQKLKLKIDLKQGEIFGKVANAGKTRGRVRVISQTNYKEMIRKANFFKRREVLVTGMT